MTKTILAINARSAAYLMFDNELSIAQTQKGLLTINQPVKGYYYPKDINVYIKTCEIK